MTVWRDDPERAATTLLEASLDDFDLATDARVLLCGHDGRAPAQLEARGTRLSRWNRRLVGGAEAAAAPPPGPFDAAFVRLPKTKDELEMTAHLACGALRDGGRLFVYGGNDEGIRTAGRRLQSLGAEVLTLATRMHGRVIGLTIEAAQRRLVRADVDSWRRIIRPGWCSYPGLFADGSEDAGTALLLSVLPALPTPARVLDYGSGPGAIAAAIRARSTEVAIDAIDNDTLALRALSENVADVTGWLGCDLSAVGDRRYDLIVSNPPLHVGVREDHGALTALIAMAPARLTAQGKLMLVVQRRVALAEMLQATFGEITVVAETGVYRVWMAGAAMTRRGTGVPSVAPVRGRRPGRG